MCYLVVILFGFWCDQRLTMLCENAAWFSVTYQYFFSISSVNH